MDKLPAKPRLADYQKFLKRQNVERGFQETVPEVFMLLIEEVGEFAKAARKLSNIKTDKSSREHSVEEEAADVFYLLIDLCNHLDIDLARAFAAKERKNQKRQWQ